MALLSVRGLEKKFGSRVTALAGIDFEALDEQMTFLLGPSGAGKTTTLRLVAGLETPTAGEIDIGGRPMQGAAPRERNVAMVYDKHSLYPHLSVFENLAYPLRVRKMADADIKRRIGEVAEVLQIAPLLDRRSNQLSGGQMQRVAIGRALVRDADVFLLDEPISHLDAKLRAHMRLEFKKLQRDFHATILFVSHDQLEALTMADRIVVIDKGVKQQVGTPNDIYFRPANAFVAGFVGEPGMNLAPCELTGRNGSATFKGDGFSVTLSPEDLAGAGAWINRTGKYLLGVRPQDLVLVPEANGETENVLAGELFAVEALGSERVIDIEIGSAIMRVRAPTSKTTFINTELGSPVCARVDPRRVYLFDADTGVNVLQAAFARDSMS